LNKELGKPLALGRTAELYAWEDGRVLKLYFDWFEPDSIRFEQRMARAVHAAGLPVPAAFDLVEVNGRQGLVYERVDGTEMWSELEKRPARLIALARRTAELHAEMHANPTRPEFPSQRHRLEGKIRDAQALPASLQAVALAALARLPDGSSICHGDFHPGNILVAPGREVVIDWIDASLGNPLADVARSTIIALGAAASSQVPNPLLKISLRLFHAIYLRRYFRLRPGGKAEYRRWLPVVAAARLNENIPELESWLLGTAERNLAG
jgi:uncharacterized protein (TIGR02172 family)